MTDDSNRQLAKLAPHDQKTLSAFRHVIGGGWDILIGRGMSKPADIEFEQVDETVRHEQFLQKKGLLRYKPAHEEVPIVVLQPRGETRRTALWLDPAGKSGLFGGEGTPKPAVLKLLENGVQVVGLDLFGQGEFLPDGETLTKTRTVSPEKKVAAAYTFGYNRAVFAERVHDVLTAASYFRGDDQPLGVVDVVGFNWRRTLGGCGQGNCRESDRSGSHRHRRLPLCEFNFHRRSRFPAWCGEVRRCARVVGAVSPSEIWVADGAAAQKKPEIVESVYQAAGAPAAITWYNGPADELEATAVQWLLKN